MVISKSYYISQNFPLINYYIRSLHRFVNHSLHFCSENQPGTGLACLDVAKQLECDIIGFDQ